MRVIDQTRLPHRFETIRLDSADDAAHAIRTMIVRGAPLIGATAAYGIALAMRDDTSDTALAAACAHLGATRPTAVNLAWAIERVRGALMNTPRAERVERAFTEADAICEEDVDRCRRIGEHGLTLIEEIARHAPERAVNVLTHCNAGWLACVDHGTALSPIYAAFDRGIDVHVWVDETRPRNQGAALTAFELGAHGVPHTVIADNAGGHFMQHGMVDLCIVGADRVTASGDAANKIGTYLKALAARDNGIPFYVALPSSTIDFAMHDGRAIPIEERAEEEVTHMTGARADGAIETVRVVAPGSRAKNPGFDVTPARLVTALITERGLCDASPEGIARLFPSAG